MAFNKKLTFEGLQYYHSKIKTLFSNVNQSISDETTRATTKENEITNNLSNKQDVLIDSVTGTKAKITLENGLMCIREI